MNLSTTRSGIGDERRAWSRVCRELPELRYHCANNPLGERLDKLVTATAEGTARITQWHELQAEVADAIDAEEDFAGRGDPPAGPRDAAAIGFGCPRRLCDRWDKDSPGPAPRCALFGTDMMLVDPP